MDGILHEEKRLLNTESPEDAQDRLEENESKINRGLTWANFKIVHSKAGGLFAAFSMIYFLAYLSITALASVIQSKYQKNYSDQNTPEVIVLLFEILQVAYQVGLFFTRSSLDLFQIKRVWWVFACLVVFTLAFASQIFLSECLPVWVPILNISMIGAVGGLGYVNIYHQILCHPTVSKKERELALNINAMVADLGIILSSIVGYFCSLAWNG